MRLSRILPAVVCLLSASAIGQPAPLTDALLDRLAGTWTLRGDIAGKSTTHDIRAEWVLAHQYLRIEERSREKDSMGQAAYEAIVFIGWDATSAEYQCLWLDSTGGGGLSSQGIARGRRVGETIPFVFRDPDGTVSFNNTFSYDKGTDSWTWKMDNVQGGKPVPFGRVTLKRQ